MSGLAAFPRLRIGTCFDAPVPAGYISSPELIDRLTGLWWGCDLREMGLKVGDHLVKRLSSLGIKANAGQLVECADLIRQACLDEKLEPLVPSDQPYGLDRLNMDHWLTAGLDAWDDHLIGGFVLQQSERPEWHGEGKSIFFAVDQVGRWLQSVNSPHRVPERLSGDSGSLPGRAKITLSECVTWLANGRPRTASEQAAWETESLSRATRLVERMITDADEAAAAASFGNERHHCLDRWFAAYLMERSRIESACCGVREAIVSGALICDGCPAGSSVSIARRIPQDECGAADRLLLGSDGVAVGDGGAICDERADWTGIRFRRDELVRLWTKEWPQAADDRPAMVERPKKKRTAARRCYQELFPDGHTAQGKSWKEALQAIASAGGPNVSEKTLRRALADASE